jgi:hypothetical protein
VTLGLEGVTWLLFEALGGVLCGVIDSRGFPFPFALGLGEVRLMDGEVVAVDRREEDDVDFEREPLEGVLGIVGRRGDGEPVMEVMRVRGERAGDAECSSWMAFMSGCVGGEDMYSEVERAIRTEPVTEGVFSLVGERMGGEGVAGVALFAEVDFEGSDRVKFCPGAGAEVLRVLPASEGMDVDMRFAAIDGTGTGVAFGERPALLCFALGRTVASSLMSEALECARGLVMLDVDTDDPNVEERVVDLEKRVEDSEGL